MGEMDAAGEIVTGALLGRAVEPRAGEHDAICLNCDTALIGAHCHRCGQSGHVHRTLSGMGHDILHGVFHFDGKLWRTLPLLVWRPGELTRRYIAGERARFVSPMALFLFSIFFMFAVFAMVGLEAPGDLPPNMQLQNGFEKARGDLIERRGDLISERNERTANDPERKVIEARLARLEGDLRTIETRQAKLKAGQLDGNDLNIMRTGWHAIDHGLEKWQKNPSLMLYKLQSSSYKFSWLLIPLSLPFVWLLFFWKREYRLYDHTVFITYSIAFMSLLFVAIAAGRALGVSSAVLGLAAFLIPFAHLYRQLKQAYRLRWYSAMLRTWLLSSLIVFILIMFFAILLSLGMFG